MPWRSKYTPHPFFLVRKMPKDGGYLAWNRLYVEDFYFMFTDGLNTRKYFNFENHSCTQQLYIKSL